MFFFSCVLIHIFYKWNDLLFYFTSWFDWFCSLIMKKYNWIFNKFSVFMEFGESFYFCTNHNLIEQVNCVAKNVWFNAEMVNFLLMELLLLERNNLNLSCTHFRENLAINEEDKRKFRFGIPRAMSSLILQTKLLWKATRMCNVYRMK